MEGNIDGLNEGLLTTGRKDGEVGALDTGRIEKGLLDGLVDIFLVGIVVILKGLLDGSTLGIIFGFKVGDIDGL